MKSLILLLILISSQSLFGCMCMFEKVPNKTDIEVGISNHDWIGIGRIIEEKNGALELKYTLETSLIYKGKEVENQVVVSGPGNCGFVFEKNIEYLVYGIELENGEIPIEPSISEILFLARIVKDTSVNVSEIELFYHDKKLLSKKEFFSLNPTYIGYAFRRLSSGDLKMISPEVRDKARNGILIADYGYDPNSIKRYKLIRRINRCGLSGKI